MLAVEVSMKTSVNRNDVFERNQDHTVSVEVEGASFRYTVAVRIRSGMCRVPRRESERLGLSGCQPSRFATSRVTAEHSLTIR